MIQCHINIYQCVPEQRDDLLSAASLAQNASERTERPSSPSVIHSRYAPCEIRRKLSSKLGSVPVASSVPTVSLNTATATAHSEQEQPAPPAHPPRLLQPPRALLEVSGKPTHFKTTNGRLGSPLITHWVIRVNTNNVTLVRLRQWDIVSICIYINGVQPVANDSEVFTCGRFVIQSTPIGK